MQNLSYNCPFHLHGANSNILAHVQRMEFVQEMQPVVIIPVVAPVTANHEEIAP